MKTLTFASVIQSIICLNGTISSDDINLINSFGHSIPIIAADGAANKLLPHVAVDFVIGDLDSVNTQLHPTTKILKIQDQNKYDFEKALDFAMQNGNTEVLIVGINGGEYEHSINNGSIFIKYSEWLNLYCFTKNRIGTMIKENVLLQLKPNDIVSIIPANEAIVSSKGLRGELNNTHLKLGATEGARNEAVASAVELTLHSGRCAVFVPKY